MMHTAFEKPKSDSLRFNASHSSPHLPDRSYYSSKLLLNYIIKSGKKQCKILRSPAKETARSVASTWTTSGTVGTRDCVLLFRLAALKNTGLSPAPPPVGQSLSSSSSTVKVLEPSNRITPLLTISPYPANKKLNMKRAHESLSSSDTSISSAYDDAADNDDSEAKETTAATDHPAMELPNVADDTINHAGRTGIAIASTSSAVANTEPTSSSVVTVHSGAAGKENIGVLSADTAVDAALTPVNVAEMPGRTMNINYRFQNTETRLLRRILNSHGLTEVDDTKPVSLLWSGSPVKTDVLRCLLPYQRVNHFPRSSELTRKDRLYKNIEKMQHLRGFKQFDIVPQSFMLPMEYRNLVSAHRSSQKMPWIVKPAASSRGRGIFLVHSPEQIPMDEQQVLVSRYITNPLCIDGHKCDVRLYVAVTSFDPLLIYLYDEGLVRLATVKYDKSVENLWNPCMHLCNYSINKYHSDYIKAPDACEDVGHKWSFSALLRHLKSQGCDTRELMLNIEDVIIKSIFACAQSIASACRMFVPSGNNCFELYGYDILIDDTLKPWLLEVNMSPSLGVDTPLDTKVKASMIADLLTLVGIPTYDATNRPANESKWSRYRCAAGIAKCQKSSSSTDATSGGGGGGAANRRTTSTTTTNASGSNPAAPSVYLSQEELRIVRHARAQHERMGGFVRIYPTADSMQRFGNLMDPVTGIPMSTVTVHGISTCSMILPHNYNQMLFGQLYPGRTLKRQIEIRIDERMAQYERPLQADAAPLWTQRSAASSSDCVATALMAVGARGSGTAAAAAIDECKKLRRQLRKLIESGVELSQLQARRLFQRYLEAVLERLATEPSKCSHQEKSILKFITRSDVTGIRTPSFIKNPNFPQQRVLSKDRSALVAKLLGDYLELYRRDSEAFVDDFDPPGIIPRRSIDEFLAVAVEADIESVLTLHTNVTQSLPFLSTRATYGLQAPPPIPTGAGGFLRALPAMVAGSGSSRDNIDTYYRSLNAAAVTTDDSAGFANDAASGGATSGSKATIGARKATTTNVATVAKRDGKLMMSTSTTLPAKPSKSQTLTQPMKKRSVSQSVLHR